MNHFDAVDFSECRSEEVMFLLTLSVSTCEYRLIFKKLVTFDEKYNCQF